MIITGFILIILILAGGVLLAGESPLVIWDLPSLMMNLGIIAATLIAGNQAGAFLRGCKYIFMKSSIPDRTEIESSILSFDLAFKSALASGFIGLLMGIVLMLVNLKDATYIWVYLAVCLLTLLYGILLAFGLFMPCSSQLKKMAERKDN